ncbi:tryptophan--tRNA ligase [Candidatus Peregrinibacteria bacterium]|nr:tryptophan--tRNA ligase [Candidatus Peregrinibacteria bacterium]
MKKRVLSGIQPSGKLHIGNYFGMIQRMVQYQEKSDLFLFLANLHALTSSQDPKILQQQTEEAVLDLLALGIDPKKSHFWIQSDVPEVTELMWILSCVTPLGLLERAHSFKDKIAKGIDASHGLFSYPILMAADILLYRADIVPVGRDQKQHLEIARDIALKFNHGYGEILTIPEPDIAEDVAVIPGADGQKMSKSYGNTIDIFAEEKELKKRVMSIVTDSTPVEAPKNPDTCIVYQLHKLFLSSKEAKALADRYRAGEFGYGDAKKMLFEALWETFRPYREKRAHLEKEAGLAGKLMSEGAAKVRAIAAETLNEVRKAVGLK